MRVVLYAEGAGELRGDVTYAPPVGDALPESSFGAGHVLVRRALVAARGIEDVRFDSPLRHRGRTVRGSDLVTPRVLRQLVAWPKPSQRPDLAVFLVDADGDLQRRNVIVQTLRDAAALSHAVGLAIQEFEAWLTADERAVAEILGAGAGDASAPEARAPRASKARLDGAVSRAADTEPAWSIRRRLAAAVDLDVVARRCPAFEAFLQDLRSV